MRLSSTMIIIGAIFLAIGWLSLGLGYANRIEELAILSTILFTAGLTVFLVNFGILELEKRLEQ